MRIHKMTDQELNAIVNASNYGPRVEEAWAEIERRRLDQSINESIYGASGREDESLDPFPLSYSE